VNVAENIHLASLYYTGEKQVYTSNGTYSKSWSTVVAEHKNIRCQKVWAGTGKAAKGVAPPSYPLKIFGVLGKKMC